MKKSALLLACFIAAGTIGFTQTTKEAKVPPPPPPAPPKVEVVKFTPPKAEMDAFYKRNPSVADAYWNKKNHLVVKLKNKSTEEYNLGNEKEKENFTSKYGAPLQMPPPPPPVKVKS
ncbi:MAG: hypothetical protein ABUT20_01430 [Bacteroidota bacterium]